MVNYNKLESLMKERGVSQSFISEKVIGKSRNYIKDCKRNKSDIPDDRLEKIAEILGTTPEYLRDETDDPGIKKEPRTWQELNLRPKVVELMNTLDGLSDEQLIKALKMINLLVDGENDK